MRNIHECTVHASRVTITITKPRLLRAGPIKINIVTLRHDKRWRQCEKISEATPKIGNNSTKPKQLNVVNTDKTRSKRTRSQFPFQTLLTMIPRIVTMSN